MVLGVRGAKQTPLRKWIIPFLFLLSTYLVFSVDFCAKKEYTADILRFELIEHYLFPNRVVVEFLLHFQ